MIQIGENCEILKTNLQPFFWRKVKTIIRQNQKCALLEFLFGKDQDQTLGLIPHLEDQIQTLQNQMDYLQQEISELKHNQILEIKKTLSELLKRSEASKIDQPKVSYTSSERSEQYDSNLKPNMVSYLQENDNKINLQVQKPRDEISKSFSEGKISPVKSLSNTQPYNIP